MDDLHTKFFTNILTRINQINANARLKCYWFPINIKRITEVYTIKKHFWSLFFDYYIKRMSNYQKTLFA